VSGSGLTGNKQGKRQVPAEFIQQFKDAIQGSDLTKIALVEALKKQFPKVPKDAIQTTLSLVALRKGPSNDKKWVLCE
jgi:chromatin assembly factor 1 subunit A